MAEANLENARLLNEAMAVFGEGKFDEAINLAKNLSNLSLTNLQRANTFFIYACASKEMGKINDGLLNLLEGHALLENENQPELIAHFEDEIARILYNEEKFNAALFFINSAIENFRIAHNPVMKDSCEKLRESILWNL